MIKTENLTGSNISRDQ